MRPAMRASIQRSRRCCTPSRNSSFRFSSAASSTFGANGDAPCASCATIGAVPPDAAVFAQGEGFVVRACEPVGACEELAFEALQRGGAQGAAVNAFGARIGREAETFQLADGLAADDDAAGIVELSNP